MSYHFVNPYNFISLNDFCRRIKVNENEEKLSGYIDCELETLTPLIMVDSMSKEEHNQHVTYPKTFMLNNVPSIPASELRGCIRSKFETLTNSCFVNYEGDDIFYGRFKDGAMRKAGILDFTNQNDVRLFTAKKYEVDEDLSGTILDGLKSGEKVSFDIISRDEKEYAIITKKGGQGIYKLGEIFKKEEHKHVFVMKNDITDTILNGKKLKKLYEKCRELGRINSKKGYHNSATDADYRPVWYQVIGGYVYIALGQNGQVQYEKNMDDVLPKSYHACHDESDLCEACYVFGTVNNNLAISSKVRISDARAMNVTKDNCYWKNRLVVLPELASPRFTNAYFYLQAFGPKGEELLGSTKWNVDTLVSGKEEYKFFGENQIKIRGRKEYWHHEPSFPQQDANKMNVTVNPIKVGAKYQFKVYFDDLTKEQLEHLQMAISLGKSNEYAHKLGMGKPLGFGSVKIRVQQIMVRKVFVDKVSKEISRKFEKYEPKSTGLKSAFLNCLNSQQLREIECMYSVNYLTKFFEKISYPVEVDYPRNAPVPSKYDRIAVEDSKIFKWFASNPREKLPKADSRELVMEGYVKNKNGNRNGNKNGYRNGNRNGYRNGNRNGRY